MIYILLISSGVMNGIAQVLWKIGVNGMKFDDGIFGIIYKLFSNPYFLGGSLLYFFSILLWFYILSKMEVSSAYPFIALSFVIVAIGGYFLGETISLLKILGVIFIICGIFLIVRS